MNIILRNSLVRSHKDIKREKVETEVEIWWVDVDESGLFSGASEGKRRKKSHVWKIWINDGKVFPRSTEDMKLEIEMDQSGRQDQ